MGKTKKTRREILDNAAKNYLIMGLSGVQGSCEGLGDIDMRRLQRVLGAEEVSTWANIARNCARRLLEFAAALTGGAPCEDEQASNAARILGSLGSSREGGLARMKRLTPEQRSELARHAVMARWGKFKKGA
jgi:hypothetical protein